ncbi:MAG: pseudouridine synthase [Lachnospiraceae bacterium]|nr:pseudouridine synthase [Lachnospiraceae bacterium]
MRLDKYLADMGVATRSELKKAIRKGAAEVNGAVAKDPGMQVSEADEVTWFGKKVGYASVVYYMLNKPAGVISATEDRHHRTVLDLVFEYEKSCGSISSLKRKDLFPVGRLDIDTEGLLLITNDGALAHQLLSPKHHVDKTYFVRLDKAATEEDVQLFAKGFRVDDELTAMPAKLELLPDQEARITIHEGKFHQIKRMFHAVGKEVLYLKRLSMGPLVLDEALDLGKCRPLTEAEVAALKKQGE